MSTALEGASLLHVAVPCTDVAAAAAFYEASCGMKTQRTDSLGNVFVGFGSEGGGEHVTLKLFQSSLKTRPQMVAGSGDLTLDVVYDDEVFLGISVAVPDLEAAMAKAQTAGAGVLRPFCNTSVAASMVPDEEAINEEHLRPWYLRGVVQDPYSGLSLELTQTVGDLGGRLAHVSLRVPDLVDAEKFFTKDLGMTLHRKKSLVPAEPALSAFVSYGATEQEGTLVELRYSYGRAYGRYKSKSPKQTATLALSVPDVAAAVEELSVGGASSLGDDENGDNSDLAGWGEALFLAKEGLDEARAAGDLIKVKASKFRIAQLEYKKPTKAMQAEGSSEWAQRKCEVVQGVGEVAGWGEEAAVLGAAHPDKGFNLVLIDELDFLKQTLV